MRSWLLIGLLIFACRDKDPDSIIDPFEPPYGVIGSAVGGELAFFDLDDMELITLEQQQGWATACELQPINNHLITIDSEAGGFAIYDLPDVEAVQHFALAGTPVDLKLDRSQLSAHVITRNGLYYRIAFSNLEADTVDTGTHPRRIALRPPVDFEAWVPCVGDNTIRVIKLQGFFEVHRFELPAACTDVCFSSDGNSAYCALPDLNSLYVLDAENGEGLDTLALSGTIIDLAISLDGRYLAAADSNSGDVRVWDLTTGDASTLRCGSGAIRIRYSIARASFIVICPAEAWVLSVDPLSSPLSAQDTLTVTHIPQCMSFSE